MTSVQRRDDGRLRILTIERPPGNALDLACLRDLRAGVEDAARDTAVRAIILTGKGGAYFSSGLDLDEMETLPDNRKQEPFETLVALYRTILACPKPTVAGLSGSAILGGWVIAMSCDWRILSSEGKIALSEIRAALTPTSALIARLDSLCRDPRVVKDMVLRGRSVPADEAFAAGLVDEVCPPAEVEARVLQLGRRVAKSPPRAFAAVKRALNASAADEVLWRRALAEFSTVFSSDEAREGVAALRAKRRPRWEDA